MASRRKLKKQISYIAGDLFLASLVEGVDRAAVIEATHNVLNLIPRISHTQPGNVKGYYKNLNEALNKEIQIVASELAKTMVAECADFARLSQSRVYENLSFRANVIAFLKAMVLYVAHGEVWTPEMEDFIRWSLKYDLWCKMQFFGKDIEDEEEGDNRRPARGPQNLLDPLPEVFTREEAGLMRQRLGVRGGSLRQMLNNWKSRGYIDCYGEVLTRNDINRQQYIKTEEYRRTHPRG